MQQIIPFTISAPGFLGLNIQDSPVDLNNGFALAAINCVIDKSGRISARNGWAKTHTANADLATNDISVIAELIENDGTTTILAAGGGFLFKQSGSTLTTLTYGGGGSAPTITTNNWQVVQLNGVAVFFQIGYDPLIYDPSVSTSTYRRLSEKTGYIGAVPLANCAVSAYGRIWCANTTTNKNTVAWSDLITPHIWTGGTSGTLNLLGVWPQGGDEIVALAAHNNFLIIFGKKQTLVYSGANTPSTMLLSDTINNVGCIARDSVQNIGEDLLFLSNVGVKSLMRTIQEKSAPLRELSKNVRDELQSHISTQNMDNVKSIYSPRHAFYLLTLPSYNETYCFDMRYPLDDGSARATTWDQITPRSFMCSKSGKLYIGKQGYIGEYSGYADDASQYRMVYLTAWMDFGSPAQITILKKIILTLLGTTSQVIIFKWAYDFISIFRSQTTGLTSGAAVAEYGIAEYGIAEYGSGLLVNVIQVNAGGSGKAIQFGFEAQVSGSPISIQRIDIHTKEGRI